MNHSFIIGVVLILPSCMATTNNAIEQQNYVLQAQEVRKNTEVSCKSSGSGFILLRNSDQKPLGLNLTESDCRTAAAAAKAGVVCSKTQKDWMPTIIRLNRPLGYSGVATLAVCNQAIQFADKLTICTYTGGNIGWKTTRTYALPQDPNAQRPHRLLSSFPHFEDCLLAAQHTILEWEKDAFYHQTCAYNGGSFAAMCPNKYDPQLISIVSSIKQCIEIAKHHSCKAGLSQEVLDLKKLIDGENTQP